MRSEYNLAAILDDDELLTLRLNVERLREYAFIHRDRFSGDQVKWLKLVEKLHQSATQNCECENILKAE